MNNTLLNKLNPNGKYILIIFHSNYIIFDENTNTTLVMDDPKEKASLIDLMLKNGTRVEEFSYLQNIFRNK